MRVLVAGGGIAALQTLAGLKAIAADEVDATLLAPESDFSYRPLSTAVPFTFGERRTRGLGEIADDLGARFVQDALVEVDQARRRVLTGNGDFLPYDALVLAVGARTARAPQPGTIFRRDEGGISGF